MVILLNIRSDDIFRSYGFFIFGRLLINLVVWFSIYSVFWIRSSGPARSFAIPRSVFIACFNLSGNPWCWLLTVTADFHNNRFRLLEIGRCQFKNKVKFPLILLLEFLFSWFLDVFVPFPREPYFWINLNTFQKS